jgi:hypothetical protein
MATIIGKIPHGPRKDQTVSYDTVGKDIIVKAGDAQVEIITPNCGVTPQDVYQSLIPKI